MGYRNAVARIIVPVFAALALSACSPSMFIDAAGAIGEDRPMDTVMSDSSIALDVNTTFLNERYRYLFLDVSTNVHEGRVLLTGTVRSAKDKRTASALAREVDGVREIINELQVTPGGEMIGETDDVQIENNLKVRLAHADDVRSKNYRWRSVNGVVYLIGIAQSQAELNRVLSMAWETGQVTGVVTHVRVK